MQTLTPDEVVKRFGVLFSKGFYTLVDEKRNTVQIIEICSVKGPVEWDAVNRKKARGALSGITIDGTTLVMNAKIGKGKVNFGPASATTGGQALKSVRVIKDEVHTTWVGLAGASVGVGACIPQSPGVIRTIYPGDDIQLGGSKKIEVTVVTPKLVRLIIGIDDTDTKEKGATWVLGLKMARSIQDAVFLQHKIVQLYPKIKEKTTNCASTAVAFAVPEKNINSTLDKIIGFVRDNTVSDNTSVAVYTGLKIPKSLRDYGYKTKRCRISPKLAERVSKESGVQLVSVTGERGKIGALAAVACFDMGLFSADL